MKTFDSRQEHMMDDVFECDETMLTRYAKIKEFKRLNFGRRSVFLQGIDSLRDDFRSDVSSKE